MPASDSRHIVDLTHTETARQLDQSMSLIRGQLREFQASADPAQRFLPVPLDGTNPVVAAEQSYEVRTSDNSYSVQIPEVEEQPGVRYFTGNTFSYREVDGLDREGNRHVALTAFRTLEDLVEAARPQPKTRLERFMHAAANIGRLSRP